MKKLIRLLSALLTAIMLVASFAGLAVIDASATSTTDKKDDKATPEETLKKYLTTEYATQEDKLRTMTLKLEKDGYQLWSDELSGEVACVDTASGQILFTNPWDVASSKGTSASIKEQVLSQICVRYTDVRSGNTKDFYSFSEAGYRGQIKVKNIKGGIRVEYTIGREETRMLVPRYIRKERFETQIAAVAYAALCPENEFTYKKLTAYYLLKDPAQAKSDRARAELYAAFPITKKMAIYVFDPTASETELRRIEEIIKTYCPLYTYEELDKDHAETEYEGTDRAPALFKMALEYTLDKDSLTVRLPANGIRFDESEYRMENLSILPYMGAGANYAGSDKNKVQTGYTFLPDGSGSLFRFEELSGSSITNLSGKVYGFDFAYIDITGRQQETIRYPVFGLVSNEQTTEYVKVEEDGKTSMVQQDKEVSRGYVAIIEEGDAMAELYTYHAGSLNKYNTMQMKFYPRPKDTYNMKDAISVGTNSTQTVVSPRKYVGNYKIRYIMLTDNNIAAEKEITKYYEPTYMGMALAYRDYLTENGVLSRLTEQQLSDSIPLYIETFGSVETVEKILSIPVNTKVALTSFEDIKSMYDQLSADGVSNINFKLTGYLNGGMYSNVPYRLKWEKSVGGSNGFEELVEYAKENGFGLFPDVDFVYAQNSGYFDGLSTKKHLVKTIDNRYTSRREYSATYQTFVSYFQLAISPAYFSHFYEKFTQNYLKYGYGNISVSTLGSDLNSDFDEDDPYNREDSKAYTIEALAYLDEHYDNVMTTGGNAYSWKYVDHILDVSLDSSRLNKSSNSVPFLGIVLHGNIRFAGKALNMEGNIGYAVLRTIENGASPSFVLSYDNTTLLKEDGYLSKYYSVRYDIWYSELVEIYKKLNSVLADVQDKLIIGHEFLVGERVPDDDELIADIEAAQNELAEALAKAESAAASQAVKDILTARQVTKNNAAKVETLLETAKTASETAMASIDAIEAALAAVPTTTAEYEAAVAAEEAALEAYNAAKDAATAAKTAYNEANKGTDEAAKTAAKAAYDEASKAETAAKTAYSTAQKDTKTAKTAMDAANTALTAALNNGTTAYNDAVNASKQAQTLATEARNASDFLATVASATDAIKAAAAEYATAAEKNAAETAAYAAKATDYASAAIAISVDTTVSALVSDAEKAVTNSETRAADVVLKLENVKKAEATAEEANAAKDEALKAYEKAQADYAEATAKAALDTATAADKAAATEAGTLMNTAKTEYNTATTAATRAVNSLNSAKTALKNSLQKVLDEKNKAVVAADSVNEAVTAAQNAIETLNKLEGISEAVKTAAKESYDAAVAKVDSVNKAVETVKATYAESAELAKEYVVIEEKVEEPEPEPEPDPAPVTPDEGDETDDTTTDEEPSEEDDKPTQTTGDYEYTKYTNDDGNIVKVTFGDTDANGRYLAYKTFILNYNFFDVTVVIDGIKYTIPQSGYVVYYN